MTKSMLKGLGIAFMIAAGVSAQAASWETDFAKASLTASKAGTYMLLDFSGSDWCGWCMRLEKEVFSKAEFKTFAKANLVCVLVDFPRQKQQSKTLKEQNAELAAKYGVRGYPTVIILSPEGDLVGRTGYQEGGPKAYVDSLKTMIESYKKQHPAAEEKVKPVAIKPVAGTGK